MVIYSVIMFVTALIFLKLSMEIYKGNTDLIHDYHQQKIKVTDKAVYGKAFGKALSVFAVSMFASGLIGLAGKTDRTAMIAVAVLIVGIIIGTVCIVAVQKKIQQWNILIYKLKIRAGCTDFSFYNYFENKRIPPSV